MNFENDPIFHILQYRNIFNNIFFLKVCHCT